MQTVTQMGAMKSSMGRYTEELKKVMKDFSQQRFHSLPLTP